MKKLKTYTYLGTNGTISTPVHLENIYSIVKYQLTAEEGYKLTKDGVELYTYKIVDESELKLWYEVKDKGQE